MTHGQRLLDISRVTRQVVLQKAINAGGGGPQAVEASQPLIEDCNHHLTITLPSQLCFWKSPRRMAQVLSNLLNNAAKYTDEGRVSLAAEQLGVGS
jgi:signal transduction histidine kinase